MVVGEPVPVADLLHQAREEQWEQPRLYAAIAARVEDSLQRLHAEAKGRLAGTLDAQQQQQQGCVEGASGRTAAAQPSGEWPQGGGELSGAGACTSGAAAAWQSSGRHQERLLGAAGGSRSGGMPEAWWGPAQLRQWDTAAFSMWHRGWAERLAVLQASYRGVEGNMA